MKPLTMRTPCQSAGGRPPFGHLATLLGAVIVATALLVAFFAPYLTPHDPFAQDLDLRLIPPIWMDGSQVTHLLGTDRIGRDTCRA